jgi:uncharacterized protein (TIGR03663 family)
MSSLAGISPMPLVRWERWAWGALLAATLCIRLVNLGDRPLHHDESIHAWFTDHLVQNGEYKYDPVYHGPVQYYVNAVSFLIFRDSDFTARLPAALGGTGLVLMALLLRARFGSRTAFAAGVLMAFSPNLLYYTRFCREDVWTLLGTAGTFLFLDRWFRERRIASLVAASFWAVIAFASKENFYVLLALMAPSVAVVFWEPGEGIVFWPKIRKLVDFLEVHTTAIVAALLFFFVLSEVLYTFFFVNMSSWNPAFDAISYWWGQHKVERVGGPKTFYLPRLLQYEFVIVLPALVIAFRRLFGKSTPVDRFLAMWGIGSIGMYGYLGEKTPWLIVHQILPLIPFAAEFWGGLDFTGSKARTLVPVAGVASFVTALSLSFWLPDLTPARERAESVIYVQTAPEVLAVVDDIRRVARTGVDLAASVDGEAGWPMSWYLRRLPVEWVAPQATRKPPVVLCDPAKEEEIAAILGPGYEKKQIPLRVWWVPETSLKPLMPTPGQLLSYLFTRKVWCPLGSTDIIVFRDASRIPPKR